MVKHISKNHSSNRFGAYYLTGCLIFRLHRVMTKPSFHRNHISDFRLFAKYAEDAIDQANTRLRAGHPIDIQVYTKQASTYVCYQ